MTVLRAGVIGLGAMGRNHARVLSMLDGVELVGVADPAGDRFHAARGVAVFGTPEALLERGLDFCTVATPTEDHEAIGVLLARSGVHALIEKPLAHTLDAAERLVAAFATGGLVGAVGHVERYNPSLQELRRRLTAGDLGAIFQIATRRQGPFPSRIKDVGVIKDLATHDVDLTAWVARSPYVAVSARIAYKTGRPHEDLVAATGVLADGTITNHLVNWLKPTKERVTEVLGERGAYVADTLSADLTFYANGETPLAWDAISTFRGVSEGDMIRYAIEKPEPLVTELAAMRDAVLGKAGDIVPMADGLAAVRVAEALLASASTGSTVAVDTSEA